MIYKIQKILLILLILSKEDENFILSLSLTPQKRINPFIELPLLCNMLHYKGHCHSLHNRLHHFHPAPTLPHWSG